MWLDRPKKQRIKALKQKDNEALINMTGKPNLSETSKSWARAMVEEDKIKDFVCAKEDA